MYNELSSQGYSNLDSSAVDLMKLPGETNQNSSPTSVTKMQEESLIVDSSMNEKSHAAVIKDQFDDIPFDDKPVTEKDIRTIIDSMPALYQTRQYNYSNAMFNCEVVTTFVIHEYIENSPFRRQKPIFYVKETSKYLERNIQFADCRPFFYELCPFGKAGEEKDAFIQVERKFQWNPYCRANIDVFNVQDAMKTLIGYIKEPVSPCFLFDIFLVNGNKEETKILTIKGTLCCTKDECCQWGLFCFCLDPECKIVIFDIFDPNDPKQKVIGRIKKFYAPSYTYFFSPNDNFLIDFPLNCSYEAKMMLLATTLFIDTRYFEQDPKQGRMFDKKIRQLKKENEEELKQNLDAKDNKSKLEEVTSDNDQTKKELYPEKGLVDSSANKTIIDSSPEKSGNDSSTEKPGNDFSTEKPGNDSGQVKNFNE